MRTVRLPRVVSAVFFSLMLVAANASAQHWCGCTQPSNGYVVCQADCQYPATCVTNQSNPYYQYCFYDFVDACFGGGYDPCCDPTECIDHW